MTNQPLRRAESRMRRAIEVARGTPAGDIPVGAVLFDASGNELATGVNRREQRGDPTAHAEVEAIRAAVAVHGDGWRLSGCELVVTLEPCAMCAGAIQGARVDSVVFGAFEPKTGACGSLVEVLRAPGALHVPQVRGGVLEEECAGLMETFFSNLR
ncbi:MAG: nucleoside deaminase [Corynebacterium sp.]|nr:nucleoside deaminase [Corynebacterium sp.]MDO5033083.1 nucleoside deaminase [Corynebacterium sp.]